MITGQYPSLRLRRGRKESWTRRLIQENTLSPNDFILPIFLIDGSNKRHQISSMPGVYRYSINRLSQVIDRALKSGKTACVNVKAKGVISPIVAAVSDKRDKASIE